MGLSGRLNYPFSVNQSRALWDDDKKEPGGPEVTVAQEIMIYQSECQIYTQILGWYFLQIEFANLFEILHDLYIKCPKHYHQMDYESLEIYY